MLNDGNADNQTVIGDDESAVNVRDLIYSNSKVQAVVRRFLPIFDRRGLLDWVTNFNFGNEQ